MTLSEAIQVLEDHNIWRKGAETSPTDPAQLTEALELALETLKNVLKERIDIEKMLENMAKTPIQFVKEEPRESLRDKFAGLAMQALIQRYGNLWCGFEAPDAYKIADEMLKQRDLHNEKHK